MTWRAVIDASGRVVSEGTEVADSLPSGWIAIPVDGPANGRPWDAARKAWGQKPEPTRTPQVDPARLDAARAKVASARSIDGLREALAAVLDVIPRR